MPDTTRKKPQKVLMHIPKPQAGGSDPFRCTIYEYNCLFYGQFLFFEVMIRSYLVYHKQVLGKIWEGKKKIIEQMLNI